VGNVQKALELKKAAAVATGQNLDDDKPPPKCVQVPPGKERKVNCTEDGDSPANTTNAKSAAAGVAAATPLK
jgi:hypothetical protein